MHGSHLEIWRKPLRVLTLCRLVTETGTQIPFWLRGYHLCRDHHRLTAGLIGTEELLSVALWLSHAQAIREGKGPADLEQLQRPSSQNTYKNSSYLT